MSIKESVHIWLGTKSKACFVEPPFFLFLFFLPQGDIEGPNGLDYWDVNSQVL